MAYPPAGGDRQKKYGRELQVIYTTRYKYRIMTKRINLTDCLFTQAKKLYQ